MATIKTISIDKAAKELGKNFPKSQRKEVIKAVYDALLQCVKPMAERSPVDTGLYAASWEVKKTESEETVTFGNTAPYAFVIEKGARPFNAPIEPLIEWASRKLSLPKHHPEVKSFAWAIKRKFAREGMEPKNVLEKGIEEVLIPKIKENLDRL